MIKDLVDKLVEECTNVIDGDKIYNETLNVIPLYTISSNDCASCTLYVVLLVVFLSTSIIIGGAFVYFHWHTKNKQLDFKKTLLMLSIQKLKH